MYVGLGANAMTTVADATDIVHVAVARYFYFHDLLLVIQGLLDHTTHAFSTK